MSSEFEVQVTDDPEVVHDPEVAQATAETVRIERGSPDRARARELFERLSQLPSDDPERTSRAGSATAASGSTTSPRSPRSG